MKTYTARAPEMGSQSAKTWRGLPERFDVKMLAQSVGYCPARIIRDIHSGALIARKVNGKFVIDRRDAARWFYGPFRTVLTGLIKAVAK